MMQESEVAKVITHTVDMMNALSVRQFSLPPNTYIGAGAIGRTGEAIEKCGVHRVLVLTDESLQKMGLPEGMYRALKYSKIDYSVFCMKIGEPKSDDVEAAARQAAESGCGAIVAFGGGSALDAAKAVALLLANPGNSVSDLEQADHIVPRSMPLVAVPTTAGTGSEATTVTVITDSVRHVKRLLVHDSLMPDLAIIDACLMLGVPRHVTAATGVDALTHAIEAYVANGATPMTQALAYRAISLIGEALPIVVGKGSDVAARESMALASYMAGIAFSNAGLGLCHAMAHQIGATYNIPHGVANAIMLPSVMHYNQLVCKKSYPEIGLALTGRMMDAAESIRCVQQLIVDVDLPANLVEAGARQQDFARLAEDALKDPCLAANPRSADQAQIVAVFQHAYQRAGRNGNAG
ncbi:MAG: iron-containing alcohol dehydrogenase [Proteobacteria bacterium]|nr:iron-containing alcohol dehydrogenase [Pseudomonadota bacterium]